jgi:hypothetical protein
MAPTARDLLASLVGALTQRLVVVQDDNIEDVVVVVEASERRRRGGGAEVREQTRTYERKKIRRIEP